MTLGRVTRPIRPAAAAIPRSTAGLSEQTSRNGDVRHLEYDIATMAVDLRADPDQPFLQARQQPVLDRLRRRERTVILRLGQTLKLTRRREALDAPI